MEHNSEVISDKALIKEAWKMLKHEMNTVKAPEHIQLWALLWFLAHVKGEIL